MKITIIPETRPGIMKMPKTISQRGVHFIVKAFITTMMEIMDKELGKQLVFMNDKLAGREFM